jgi:hypothetical protein
MGLILDLRARIKHARQYAIHLIQRAREFIYNLGKPIAGTAVERVLQAQSLVPTVVRPFTDRKCHISSTESFRMLLLTDSPHLDSIPS